MPPSPSRRRPPVPSPRSPWAALAWAACLLSAAAWWCYVAVWLGREVLALFVAP